MSAAAGAADTEPPVDSEGSDTLDPVGDLFHEVDEDRSGELDIDEVRKLCKRLGQKLDNAAVSRAFREMDADASGGVDLQEFRSWWENSVISPDGSFHQFMVLTERAKLVKVGLVVQLAEDTASQGVVQCKNKKKAQVDFGSDDLRWVPLTSLEVVGVAPNSANCADPAAAETASEPEPEPEPRPRSQRKPRQQPSSSLDPVPPAQVRSARSATRRQISGKEDSPRGATRSGAYTETSARQAAQEALSGLNFAVRPLRVSGAQSRLQSSEVRRRALADAEDQKAAETEAAERAFWAELREEGGRQREHLYTQRPVSAGLLRVSRSKTARPQSSRSPRIRVGSEVQREDKNSEPFERFLSRRFASPVKTVSSGAAASELVSNAEAMLQRLVAQYEEAFCSERPLSPQTPGADVHPESPQAMAAYAAGYAAGFYSAQSGSSVHPGQP